jgi:hypothetical protein
VKQSKLQTFARLRSVIPAKERVKKLASRLEFEPQRHLRESGDLSKDLFRLEEWIAAFAAMTLRSLAKACDFDFFTRFLAGSPCNTAKSASGMGFSR